MIEAAIEKLTNPAISAFAEFAWQYIDRDLSVVPIAPGSKKPGAYSAENGWRGMGDWTRFAERLPTDIELRHWEQWPGAGIGLVLGKTSGIIALDRDYDCPGSDALEQIIPYSPVKKKGAKGYTAFFRYNGERSCSFDINGMRVLDVLSDGRQTVMPPTVHPDGMSYVWITEDTLETITNVSDLPMLPDYFLDHVASILAPYQTATDIQHQRKHTPADTYDAPIDTDLSIQSQYFQDLNKRALENLDDWVPKLIPTAVSNRDGFRCVATWRNCKNANVGIHPQGIMDWGGNYGMSPLDLVMYANGIPFGKAAEALRACLSTFDTTHISITCGGAQIEEKPAVVVKPAAKVMPWAKSAVSVIEAKQEAPQPQVYVPPQTSVDPAPALPQFIANPPGILADIANWITATAPKAQPELALAAALALCSVVMARTYKSQTANFTSLYFIMVAKSTEGKEHPQSCVEKILTAADLTHLIAGSGYTSSGGVFSALLKSPAHIVTIDEIGKLLKSSRAHGNAHSEAALDKMVEAFGRQDGVMRPPTYSTMTLRNSEKPAEKIIYNPGITMLSATTPATFYDNLTGDLVRDGFLGRCIVVESKQPRQLTRYLPKTQPPARIIEWCKAVHISGQGLGDLSSVQAADMEPTTIALHFTESCPDLFAAFETELNEVKDRAEAENLDMLVGRSVEKAMKIAMIVAKSTNIHAKEVTPADVAWAVEYVRHYDLALLRSVRRHKAENATDGDLKKAVDFVRNAKKYASDKKFTNALLAGAMPHGKLLKLMKMQAKQFTDLMNTAVESGLLNRSPGAHFGMASDVYYPGDED